MSAFSDYRTGSELALKPVLAQGSRLLESVLASKEPEMVPDVGSGFGFGLGLEALSEF